LIGRVPVRDEFLAEIRARLLPAQEKDKKRHMVEFAVGDFASSPPPQNGG
jgi:hypothetical protein